jgi:hypothetical protein
MNEVFSSILMRLLATSRSSNFQASSASSTNWPLDSSSEFLSSSLSSPLALLYDDEEDYDDISTSSSLTSSPYSPILTSCSK